MIRIAITGPESSGKTALTEALGKALNVPVFPEFARSYLETLNREYVQDDLNKMCAGHLAQFNQSQEKCQVIDTDFIVLKIWSEVKYGSVSEVIQSAVDSNYFDLHILCTPDIPWEYDPQREHPHQRKELFELYKKELTRAQKPYIVVSGSLESRIEKSCEAIAAIRI